MVFAANRLQAAVEQSAPELTNFPFEMTLASQPKITPHDDDGASLSALDSLQTPHQLSPASEGHPLFWPYL